MKKLIVGNWKLYPTLSDSLVLATSLKTALEDIKGVEIAVAPPTAWLVPVRTSWKHKLPYLHLAAQNIWPEDQGAFTGEVSAYMLKDVVSYAIVGHSERRNMGEDSEQVAEKAQACLKWGITPIVCVGEEKKIIHADGTIDSYVWSRLSEQLLESLQGIGSAKLASVVIAYEPVWSISAHNPSSIAKPEYVERIIAKLRAKLAEKYGNAPASQVRFLYGGSVNATSAGDYMREREVGGLLIGSASVKAKDFVETCRLAAKLG